MTKYTQEQIEELLEIEHIEAVKNSNIIFTNDFKEKVFTELAKQELPVRVIFQKLGIPDWLNVPRFAKDRVKSWKKSLKIKENPKPIGRPKKKIKPASEMNEQEMLTRIAYLEAENDFLKKLKALEYLG